MASGARTTLGVYCLGIGSRRAHGGSGMTWTSFRRWCTWLSRVEATEPVISQGGRAVQVSSRMVSQGSCCENEARVMRGHVSLGSPRTSKCRCSLARDCQLESALRSGRVEVRTGSVSSTGESVCLDGGIERAAPTLLRFKSCTVLDSVLVSLRGPSAAMCCRSRVRQGTSALVSSAKLDTAFPGGPGRQRRGLNHSIL